MENDSSYLENISLLLFVGGIGISGLAFLFQGNESLFIIGILFGVICILMSFLVVIVLMLKNSVLNLGTMETWIRNDIIDPIKSNSKAKFHTKLIIRSLIISIPLLVVDIFLKDFTPIILILPLQFVIIFLVTLIYASFLVIFLNLVKLSSETYQTNPFISPSIELKEKIPLKEITKLFRQKFNYLIIKNDSEYLKQSKIENRTYKRFILFYLVVSVLFSSLFLIPIPDEDMELFFVSGLIFFLLALGIIFFLVKSKVSKREARFRELKNEFHSDLKKMESEFKTGEGEHWEPGKGYTMLAHPQDRNLRDVKMFFELSKVIAGLFSDYSWVLDDLVFLLVMSIVPFYFSSYPVILSLSAFLLLVLLGRIFYPVLMNQQLATQAREVSGSYVSTIKDPNQLVMELLGEIKMSDVLYKNEQ